MTPLSIFQTVGAACGIVSAAFGAWAFFTRGHPFGGLVGSPLGGFRQRTVYLEVKNPGTRPVILILQGKQTAPYFKVWPDHETLSAVHDAVGDVTTVAIDPGETKLLPLIPPAGFEDGPPNGVARYSVSWRFAQSALPFVRLPINGSISQPNYQTLIRKVQRGSRGMREF